MSAGRCVMLPARYELCELGYLLCQLGDVSYVSWEMCVVSAGRCVLCQLGDVSYVSWEM